MSTSKYTVDAKVPTDFPLVLKEFSREVLRAQPTNIYEFGAQFFKQKLAERGAAPVFTSFVLIGNNNRQQAGKVDQGR